MANSRIKISSVQISNFRSIRNEKMNLSNLNVFVGLNDTGKSNFLKALNLFFNGQTDYNTIFNFKKDFSYLFPTSSHSTKEIKIILTFTIPETYKDSGEYKWEKAWRIDNNLVKDNITRCDGAEIPARSRAKSTLGKLRYRYVPAVKSDEYYKTLLCDLYNTVSQSLSNTLLDATKSFSDALRENTNSLSSGVLKRLNLESILSVPTNLGDIFRSLVFMTKENVDDISIPLNSRGDGIQARHIPIILKYIADEDQKTRNQGSMKISTIWGFEEPENGLELSKAFEMADEFVEYSDDIQVLMSTHSPAFYMKKSSNDVSVYYVFKKANTGETSFSNNNDIKKINNSLGLMPLVAPYISEQEERYKKIQALISENYLTDIDTIMVEGISDKEYLRLAIKALSPSLDSKIIGETLRIYTCADRGGTTSLCDWVLAWLYSGFKSKLYVLFDKDAAGKKAKSEIDSSEIVKSRRSKGGLNIKYISPSEDIIKFALNNNIEIEYEIEHLLPVDNWLKFKNQKMTEHKTDSEMFRMFSSHITLTNSIAELIKSLIASDEFSNTILTHNIKSAKKRKILEWIKNEFESSKSPDIFSGFKKTIEDLEKTFT